MKSDDSTLPCSSAPQPGANVMNSPPSPTVTPTERREEEPNTIGPRKSTPIQSLPSTNNPPPLPNPNKQTKLATVKPQRISSISSQTNNFASLRPFRRASPEVPKIFFSSIRGKPPPPPSLSHFLSRNSIRRERESTESTNPQILTALKQLQTLAQKPKETTALLVVGEEKQRRVIPKLSKIPAQIKSNPKRVKSKNSGSLSSGGRKDLTEILGRPNDTNNNNPNSASATSASDDDSWKPVPHPAPRSIQTLKHSRRHTYQNIPFTRKTPRSEV